jgi:hypothetical protein
VAKTVRAAWEKLYRYKRAKLERDLEKLLQFDQPLAGCKDPDDNRLHRNG